MKKISSNVIALLFLLGIIYTSYIFYQKYQAQEEKISVRGGDRFIGFDWIRWENTTRGIEATFVHPILKSNTLLQGISIQEHDVLTAINYQKVYTADMANEIIRSAKPGEHLIYQVLRDDPEQFRPFEATIIIQCGYYPTFTYPLHKTLWQVQSWILVLVAASALTLWLILIPIIKQNIKTYLLPFSLITSVLFWYIVQNARYFSLILEIQFFNVKLERWLLTLLLILWNGINTILFFNTIKYSLHKYLIILVILVPSVYFLMSSVVVVKTIFIDSTYQYHAQVLSFVVQVSFLISVLHYQVQKILHESDSGYTKLFVSVVYLVFSAVLLWNAIFNTRSIWRNEVNELLIQAYLVFPAFWVVNPLLRFGKVSVVVTQSILYFVGILLILVLYALIDKLYYFRFSYNPYNGLVEVLILMVIILIAQRIYYRYEHFFRRLFITTAQKRTFQIKAFLDKIPSYTASEKLLKDFIEELQAYTQSTGVEIWLSQHYPQESLFLAGIDKVKLHQSMQKKETFWARNKELSKYRAEPAIEEFWLEQDITLIFALEIPNEQEIGFLMLKRKKTGVFNLYEVELIRRAITQLQLTLEVLYLLEKEKILIQKNAEANLIALRSQINPHFLFNTLNTISALIHYKPDLAEQAVEKLAFIFRYTLKYSNENFVTVQNEMSLVKSYLAIEQLRFGEQLEVSITVQPETQTIEIPAFCIQTLVENAVKHGLSNILYVGQIKIDIFMQQGYLFCTVYDNGVGMDISRKNKGTGINNIESRLKKLYHREGLLCFEKLDKGTRVTLKIPLMAHNNPDDQK
ncbi:MAG: histidine kinase [Bacteroidia bacterium]|nr:histidine kinase [Bacteroidia bacterium]MDW8346359.1 histidine kinase [Bacteroidia bacterium]